MKIVIQRVKRASVSVEGTMVANIQQGLLLFVGIEVLDTMREIDSHISKFLKMRIFSNDQGKMDLSIEDIRGQILVVSQFTLAASLKSGTRPSFDAAMEPIKAQRMYNLFLSRLGEETQLMIQSGHFGADMQVELVNDGPVTFYLN